MTTEIAFDTLKMVERFQSAGFSADQARMTTTILAEVIAAEDTRIAERFSNKQDVTLELIGIRSDIHMLRQELRQESNTLRQESNTLRQEMKAMNADTKAELVRWVVGVGLLQMALISGLVLKLVH
ncbi:MAG: DUF1640 domain-containing protein [Burkholderiaceae bacterium]|nr:DUF1640 domain-containing protein [Burkholderiaceae bacterium]